MIEWLFYLLDAFVTWLFGKDVGGEIVTKNKSKLKIPFYKQFLAFYQEHKKVCSSIATHFLISMNNSF